MGVIREEDRRPLWVMGGRLDIVIGGDQTDGAFAVAEDRSHPGFGVPPHIHRNEDESFYVIQGEYLFGSEDGEVRARPGTFIHSPKGHLHWWRNDGDGPGRHLEIFSPAGLEKLFEEIGQPITDPHGPPPPPDPQRLFSAAPHFGVEFKMPN